MPPIASVDVPASSANLGSGFDAFAVALSLKLRAELYHGDETGILLNVHGEVVPEPNDDPDQNLVIRAFREGLRVAHGSAGGSGAWRIEVSSMIPAARGLGSSAAAIVAGLLLGASVGRSAPPVDDLLDLAAALEGHPDNVAAALYGGFTLAVAGDEDNRLLLRRFRVPDGWIPIMFVASAGSRTTEMRSALPDAVPHADAARQVARSALLATAVMTGDASLLRRAMDDRLHQPYRLPLLAGASELIEVAYQHGAA
ncbi:MAG TPA: homoserine kinase, partial [Candidatus Limnocylindrales bacterium]|nr:homoserine kinase [Candidatus Limnocylindrales bacterium]